MRLPADPAHRAANKRSGLRAAQLDSLSSPARPGDCADLAFRSFLCCSSHTTSSSSSLANSFSMAFSISTKVLMQRTPALLSPAAQDAPRFSRSPISRGVLVNSAFRKPEGLKQQSPGQRPGNPFKLRTALKGRENQWHAIVPPFQGWALGHHYPGRCPGLCCFSLSGLAAPHCRALDPQVHKQSIAP